MLIGRQRRGACSGQAITLWGHAHCLAAPGSMSRAGIGAGMREGARAPEPGTVAVRHAHRTPKPGLNTAGPRMVTMMPGHITAAHGKNVLSVSAGIITSVWQPGSVVDVHDAKEAMRAVEQITGGTPMPMLSEMTDVEISAAARYEFAQTAGVLAIAVLGSSTVDRVVAAAMKRHTRYPHEFFTSRDDAMAWLNNFAAGGGSRPEGYPDGISALT